MAETNYGIANTGPGSISMTDSPVTFHGASKGAPPVRNTGSGTFTINGEPTGPITNTGPDAVNIGPGSGGASGGGSRWPDATGSSSGGHVGSGEFQDLASVHRFAEQIVALGEGSDFVQTLKACAALQEMIRDFGGDMNREVVAFVESAIAVATFGEQLRDQAAQVAGLARDMSGD